MAQIRITSPQAVGSVTITAIVPGIVTYPSIGMEE